MAVYFFGMLLLFFWLEAEDEKRIYLIGDSGCYSAGSRALDLPDYQRIPEGRPELKEYVKEAEEEEQDQKEGQPEK